ncbi:MAG TPA: J domain-containing protein [Candidatus Nanoarchaeia archaeon]|nr:J domain-containing protein [Candidatus Nanoarchaeia archaeon]
MDIISVKGYEFKAFNLKESSFRRVVQFRNDIINALSKLGLTEDDIDVPLETVAIKKAPASATWYMDGFRMYYDYKSANRFIENLYIITKVIELEVAAVISGEKTIQEFIQDFSEEKDIKEQRKEARKVLGVNEDSLDLEQINSKYKLLAKRYHPDMPEGSTEKFKLINNAHKMLKRELA